MVFCPEHSEVMRCLGALEEGQKNIGETVVRIDFKIDKIQNLVANGTVVTAVEKTKSKILYWVIGAASTALIAGLLGLFLKKLVL
jgi:hypothetical protein